MKKSDLIKRIEKLEQLRAEAEQEPEKATNEAQSVTVATFEGEAHPTTLEPKIKPPEPSETPHGNNDNGNPMPMSLQWMSMPGAYSESRRICSDWDSRRA